MKPNQAARGKIYKCFSERFTAIQASEFLDIDLEYVDELYLLFESPDVYGRKKESISGYAKAFLNVRTSKTNFALETNNQYVIEAYNRMINPQIK